MCFSDPVIQGVKLVTAVTIICSVLNVYSVKSTEVTALIDVGIKTAHANQLQGQHDNHRHSDIVLRKASIKMLQVEIDQHLNGSTKGTTQLESYGPANEDERSNSVKPQMPKFGVYDGQFQILSATMDKLNRLYQNKRKLTSLADLHSLHLTHYDDPNNNMAVDLDVNGHDGSLNVSVNTEVWNAIEEYIMANCKDTFCDGSLPISEDNTFMDTSVQSATADRGDNRTNTSSPDSNHLSAPTTRHTATVGPMWHNDQLQPRAIR